MLLGKIKLDAIETVVSKALIDLYNSHNEFVSLINLFRKFKEMIEEIKNPKTSVQYTV